MKAVCVEDEVLTLNMIISLCQKMPDLKEVKGFQKAMDVLEYLKENTTNILLIDIDLPDMNGITLGEQIKEEFPAGRVVQMLLTLGIAMSWVKKQGLDPLAILLEKHEFNRSRPYKHGKRF